MSALASQQTPINLTTKPDTVIRPGMNYVFLEKIGPFQTNAPQAWQDLHRLIPAIAEHNQITGYCSLYEVERQVYRAGVSVTAEPQHLPAGVSYEQVPGGEYVRFTLTGAYSQLPEASRRAFEMVSDHHIPIGGGYNIENYVSDPRTTPEEQLITEILFPVSKKPAATDESAILAVIDGMAKARYDKSAQAIAAPYAPDAAIFNLAPPLVHHGIDIPETQEWLDTWDGPIQIEPRNFEITVAGDIAFCHGLMRMTGNKKGVDQPVRFWMRETLCLKRNQDTWRIVHEHTSVPFYMDGSLRPAFDLEPESY